MNKFDRSIPFFSVLVRADKKQRKTMINTFPVYVLDDICEILYNILCGNVSIPRKHRSVISKHNKKLINFLNEKSHPSRRSFVKKQNGGFISAILPLLAAVIGATL